MTPQAAASLAKTHERYPMPCSTCTAACCGPVPVTVTERDEILAAVAVMAPDRRKRLASQGRPKTTCPMVDMDTRQCSVWDARPGVCRLYGYANGLQCPHRPVGQVIAAAVVRDVLADWKENGPVAILGVTLGWAQLAERNEASA